MARAVQNGAVCFLYSGPLSYGTSCVVSLVVSFCPAFPFQSAPKKCSTRRLLFQTECNATRCTVRHLAPESRIFEFPPIMRVGPRYQPITCEVESIFGGFSVISRVVSISHPSFNPHYLFLGMLLKCLEIPIPVTVTDEQGFPADQLIQRGLPIASRYPYAGL